MKKRKKENISIIVNGNIQEKRERKNT